MSASAALTLGRRPAGSILSRRGDVLVSEAQRARMLSSVVEVVAEHGYAAMSVSRVAGRAGVSRRTFYDVFEDREDCFLAAFEDALALLSSRATAAYAGERTWRAKVRASLAELLVYMDQEPAVCSLVVVDALQAGPRVLARRAEVLAQISRAVHRGGVDADLRRNPPPLTGEGIVGAVLGLIHTRLLAQQPSVMAELLNPLMGMIVLPYLGSSAAQKELTAAAPLLPSASSSKPSVSGAMTGLPMRITRRTLLVLNAISEQPGRSNRQVGDAAGIPDPGQISRLLARLEGLGLIANASAGQPNGEPNAWQLTPRGAAVKQATLSSSPGGGS